MSKACGTSANHGVLLGKLLKISKSLRAKINTA